MARYLHDTHTVTYCTAEDVSMYYRGGKNRTQADVSLQATSGTSQTGNEDKVYLTAANAALFYDQERVTVYDDANPLGEEGTIESILFNGNSSYLDLEDDLGGDYTTGNSAKVKLRGYFNKDTMPDIQTVHRMINDAEDFIDQETNHAWRSTTVTNEYHNRPFARATIWPGTAIPLQHRDITNFTSGTDKIEVFTGTDTARAWTDYVSTKTEGRDNDWWCDYTNGIIYIRAWFHIHATSAVRVTYRYGTTTVPKDIRKCCAMIVARDLLEQEQHLQNQPGDTGQGHTFELSGRISTLQRQIDRILSRHKEVINYLD